MPLTNSNDSVVFSSESSVDKIVKVYEEPFDPSEAITHPGLSSSGIDIYVYRRAHNLGRPVYTELLWSDDGGNSFVDGGSGQNSVFGGRASISFSDNTYAYMISPSLTSPYATTLYSKIICSWIDNYDENQIFITPERNSKKPILFDSRDNFQKIHKQNSFTSTGLPANIAHGLTYLPNFKVFFEAFPGEVWPANFGGVRNVFLWGVGQLECQVEVGDTFLTINAGSGARVWYRIYLDK